MLAGDRDDVLVLEDLEGRSLAEVLAGSPQPRSGEELLHLAVQLARITAAVHATGVIHRDLNPFNVMIRLGSSGRWDPAIVDFDLATTFAQFKPGFVGARELAGRLAYLAPEQTGRTGQPVDRRADPYALGATLYEVATGAPPLGSAIRCSCSGTS